MARARIFTILYFFIHWQKSNGQQCSVTANPLGHQHVAQNNIVFNQPTSNQNLDSVNFNTQLQQSARQPITPQQSLNLQQLSNIPTQTNSIQQPGNLQHHGGAQSVNCQPANQALHIQQVPQNLNMKQDVPLQTSPNSVNLQQANVAPVTSPHVNIVQQAVDSQKTVPVQGLNFQQQSYAVNTQHPSHAQGGGVINFQQQTSPQSVSFQQPILVQPVNLQQQITPQDNNFQQHPIHHTNSLHLQSAPVVANFQQAPSSPVLLQQSPIVQPLNYVDLLPIQNQSPLPSSPLLQSQSLQQLPREQIEIQQHNPYNIPGGFQVISYQNPSEITTNLPVALQLSTVSSNSNPAIITAMPASLSNLNAPKQSTDNMYIVTPQNYLNPASYSPIIVTETFQPIFPTSAIVPIKTVTNTIPSSFTNLKSFTNHPEMTELWPWSLKLKDKGILTGLNDQFPIASLLESISPVQSAILSSILSSMQTPSTASQYVISSNYPGQTILTPQSGSQSSKLSLKCLLPLLLDLLQEKYTNHGCQCNCCNCQCLCNHNDFPEPQITNECCKEAEEKRTEVSLKKKEESDEFKEIPNPRRHKKENNNLNVIPDDSKEIEDMENSSCEDEEEHDDVVDESAEENDTDNSN